jgi:hypothetical protein
LKFSLQIISYHTTAMEDRTIYDTKFKSSLERYVNLLDLSVDISNNIKRGIKTYGDKITQTLYRGQSQSELNIHSSYWFSTSSDKNIAQYFARGKDGIIYIIHVIDTHAIVVNDILTRDEIGEHYSENEIIIDGKGKFYNSNSCLVEGFYKINDHLYEAWYTTQEQEPQEPQQNIANIQFDFNFELFYINNADELEMIDTLEEFKLVFTEFNDMSKDFIQNVYNLSKSRLLTN